MAKFNKRWKFNSKIRLKDNFTKASIKIKWKLKIRPKNSAKRQLYRELNQIKTDAETFQRNIKSH